MGVKLVTGSIPTQQTQGLTYCRPEKKGKGSLGRTSDKWCSCGFKRRGPNHDCGNHHKGIKMNRR